MARIEKQDGRAHLRLVLWGPPCSGKAQALATIHGACEAPARGGRIRLEENSNTAGQVEYAFLDLPPWDGRALRLHCLTAGDSAEHQTLRRRLLTETDAVLFVAPRARDGGDDTLASWLELIGHLDGIGGAAQDVPVGVVLPDAADEATGEQDLPEALASLGVPPPPGLLGVQPAGRLMSLVLRLVAHAVKRSLPAGEDASPAAFSKALVAHFSADPGRSAAPVPRLPWDERATDAVRAADEDPELVRWMQVRESDLRELERERALRRLLIDIGGVCAAAEDVAEVTRSVLVRLVMNLDAQGGWIGLPSSGGRQCVYGTRGVDPDAEAVGRLADALQERAPTARAVRVEPRETLVLEGAHAGAHGLFLSFPIRRPVPAWLLLLGTQGDALPSDVEGIVPSAVTFLGLAVARVEALEALQHLNRDLEQKVADRTGDLEREKRSLKARVRERTRELEIARGAAMESERRLLDRERREGVHQLAASLAHEMGNPLGAVRASLEFLRDGLAELGAERAPGEEALTDLREAVQDCLADAGRMAALVTSQFGSVQGDRRAVFRTEVGPVMQEALRDVKSAHPHAACPDALVPDGLTAGVAPGELTRWVYRILAELVVEGGGTSAESLRAGDRTLIRLGRPGKLSRRAYVTIGEIEEELGDAGRIHVREAGERTEVELDLPPGIGERPSRPVGEAVR